MTICCIHTNFFDDTCTECRKEYAELKGLRNSASNNKMQQQQELPKNYKEFTEERAKKLYEDLLVQFLRNKKYSEIEASQKARSIIRKQCMLRHIPFWPWL